MKKIAFSILAFFISFQATFGQDQVPMADGLRAEGKIYVVVLVLLVIFITVALYLFSIDRKISKLEKDK